MKNHNLLACLLNVLVLPGLGTFFLHRTRQALLQVFLSFAGLGLALGGALGVAEVAKKTAEQIIGNPALEKKLRDLGENERIDPTQLSPEEHAAILQNMDGYEWPLLAFLGGLLLMLGTWSWGVVTLFLPSQKTPTQNSL